MSAFSLNKTIKSPIPKHPYEDIKNDILGKNYELSLTFVGTSKAKQLNSIYRNKTYTPNVLSFPLDNTHGDIFICKEIADKEAHEYFLTKKGYIAFLFIHGCLHLKGYDHGNTMERLEKKYMSKYAIK